MAALRPVVTHVVVTEHFEFVHLHVPVVVLEVIGVEMFFEVQHFLRHCDEFLQKLDFTDFAEVLEVVHAFEVFDDSLEIDQIASEELLEEVERVVDGLPEQREALAIAPVDGVDQHQVVFVLLLLQIIGVDHSAQIIQSFLCLQRVQFDCLLETVQFLVIFEHVALVVSAELEVGFVEIVAVFQ